MNVCTYMHVVYNTTHVKLLHINFYHYACTEQIPCSTCQHGHVPPLNGGGQQANYCESGQYLYIYIPAGKCSHLHSHAQVYVYTHSFIYSVSLFSPPSPPPQAVELPHEFLLLYITNCQQRCRENADKATQSRQVRIV